MQQQLQVNDKVYIKDEDHVWVPAKVIENNNATPDRILVEIDLPSDWVRSTTAITTSSSNIINKSSRDQHQQQQQQQQQQLEHQEQHSSPQQHGERRWVHLDDYKDRQLPLQNNSNSSSSSSSSTTATATATTTAGRDIAELPHLHEAAVLYQIKSRHVARKPYTRVGDIVIALNPCQWIDKLYTAEQRHLYAKSFVWQVPEAETMEEMKQEERLSSITTSSSTTIATATSASSTCFNSIYDKLGFEPHVYEVSALAYRGLFLDGKNQTILVSGESGAGKTETVKIVLKHLAGLETALTSDSSEADDNDTLLCDGGAVNGNELVRRVVSSSSIFEAFGNAKTLRNHNSSRFGRMTRLHFATRNDNGMCGLRGSTCQTYLLETSRVVQQTTGERNFHIFYQLLTAPSQVKRHLMGGTGAHAAEMWEHSHPSHFKYLNEPHIRARLGRATDEDQWQETLRALDFFQWKRTKLETLVRALGIILLLGNIVFTETPDGHGCVVSSLDELILVADALGIPVQVVDRAMTHQLIQTSRDRVEVPLRPEVAKDCLDALVKKIYACVFDSIVATINEHTHDADIVASQTNGIISLLDIYGFECFQVNRFEQLCINYANEKLHKKYVNDNFCRVQVEYEEQGIQAFDFHIIDNSDILEIFEGRSGLISGIDEECVRRNGCSKDFVRKAKIQHRSNERFIDEPHLHDAEFGVSHFAGPVIYDASSFVERNTDKLPYNLLSMVVNTSNPLIHESFTKILKDEQARIASDIGRKSATGRTVLEKFKAELKDLMSSIKETHTRYIRCIKPNENLSARSIDHRTVIRQLRCAGIVAAIDLSRESFPSKLLFQIAEGRFMVLLKESQALMMNEMFPQDRAQYMMSILFAPLLEVYRNCDFTLPYAIGKTMIYFRAGALELLEGLRHEYYSCRAAKIQRTWRRTSNGSRDFKRFKRSITLLQAQSRTYFAQDSFGQLKKAAKTIQFMRRSYILKRQYHSLKSGFISLQQRYRLVSERHHRYARWISATKIQSISRSWILSCRYCRMKLGFLRLQAQHRANTETKHWNDIVRAALLINSICRTHILKSRFDRTRNGFVIFQAQYRGVGERRRQAQSRADLARAIQRERAYAAVRIMGVYQTAVARTRFSQMKLGFTRFQAQYRGVAERNRQDELARAIQRERASAAVRIMGVYQTVVARRRFGIMKSGFTRFQAQYRGVAERNRHDEYKMASTILTSSVRMYPHRVRYIRLARATTIVQKRYRRKSQSRALAIQRERACAAERIMGVYRTSVARTRLSQMKSGFTRFQAQYRGVAERKCHDEYTMASTILSSSARMYSHRVRYVRLVHATTIIQKRFRRNHSCPIATMLVLQQTPADEIHGEEGRALSLAGAVTESGFAHQEASSEDPATELTCVGSETVESLEAQIKRLQNELECRNKEIADLHQDVAHVTEEAETHTQEIEAEYEDRLAAYEEEVLQLKQELQENRESHETKIERLMRDCYQQSEEYKNHLLTMSSQIEKAKETRKAETEDIMDQIQALKSEKNEKILYLQAQLARVRSTMMAPALTVASPCTDESDWSSSIERDPYVTRGAAAINEGGGGGCGSYLDEVEKLRRDLLTITATHNMVELVEKASARPWQKDVHIERLCKSVESRVNKLGDLAVQRYIMCEDPTVKHMHIDTQRSPIHVDVSRLHSPTSSLDDSSHEKP